MGFACPCCENLTLAKEPPGSGERCAECGWIDDRRQSADPELAEGPNQHSLSETRALHAARTEEPDFDSLGVPRRKPRS